MGDLVEFVVRVAIFMGIAAFLGSVASSLEKIARALTRLADAQHPQPGDRPEVGAPVE